MAEGQGVGKTSYGIVGAIDESRILVLTLA